MTAAPPESCGPTPPPPSLPWQRAQFAANTAAPGEAGVAAGARVGLVGEQQHDGTTAAATTASTSTTLTMRLNIRARDAGRARREEPDALVSQIPDEHGEHEAADERQRRSGRPRTRTASTFTVKMP